MHRGPGSQSRARTRSARGPRRPAGAVGHNRGHGSIRALARGGRPGRVGRRALRRARARAAAFVLRGVGLARRAGGVDGVRMAHRDGRPAAGHAGARRRGAGRAAERAGRRDRRPLAPRGDRHRALRALVCAARARAGAAGARGIASARMDLGIDGKVALVTGASQGIGRAIAAELAGEGARVAISSRSRDKIDATAAEIGATGFVLDSADVDAIDGVVGEIEQRLGPVDILVCNTGGPPAGPDPLGFSREQWETAYRTLVLAQITLIERAIPGMRERGFGRILNVASTSVREPIANLMLSNAHRASMVAAFKTIARHVAADGVTLNTLLPGRIATQRAYSMAGSPEAAEAAAAKDVPAGRMGKPEEMAAAAAFFCSTRASYVTGETLAIDGGFTRSI